MVQRLNMIDYKLGVVYMFSGTVLGWFNITGVSDVNEIVVLLITLTSLFVGVVSSLKAWDSRKIDIAHKKEELRQSKELHELELLKYQKEFKS